MDLPRGRGAVPCRRSRRSDQVVARDRPDIFVGSALSEQPGGPPTLYIKGPADAFVRDLVASSGVDIVVADNQPYSFDELESRKLRVHRALEGMGFRSVATSVNITGAGIIPAGVTTEPGLPTRAVDLVAALPADLREDVRLTVHEEPNVREEQAFGGMWVRDSGVNLCTSGWSVVNTSGTFGVTTAGHCPGINEINHPGHGIHSLNHMAQHRGAWGDVEWKTSFEAEPDNFYASASVIRDVGAIEARASISVNEVVCAYGRSSNDRDCTLEVQDASHACTDSGVTANRLVVMNGDTQIGGDSGGGWSVGSRAYGSHYGNWTPDFPSRDAWSVADLYDEALGVRVTCGC